MTDLIQSAQWRRVLFPLRSPYILSFTTLEEICSLQVILEVNGVKKSAEVVPLYGYSEETEVEITDFLTRSVPSLQGLSLEDARARVAKEIPIRPFAASPILTAIDRFRWDQTLPIDFKNPGLDFVVPTAVQDPEKLMSVFAKANTGDTIKVKLSDDAGEAIQVLSRISGIELKNAPRIRLDANQALDLASARRLFSFLDKSSILPFLDYVEQPLPVANWEDNGVLRKEFPTVPIMLDESVITREHLELTARLGILFVKLKLFKQGGIEELVGLAKEAKRLGLKTVLGNGVASWVSNEIEIAVHKKYPDLFWGASEANGFLKVKL